MEEGRNKQIEFYWLESPQIETTVVLMLIQIIFNKDPKQDNNEPSYLRETTQNKGWEVGSKLFCCPSLYPGKVKQHKKNETRQVAINPKPSIELNKIAERST